MKDRILSPVHITKIVKQPAAFYINDDHWKTDFMVAPGNLLPQKGGKNWKNMQQFPLALEKKDSKLKISVRSEAKLTQAESLKKITKQQSQPVDVFLTRVNIEGAVKDEKDVSIIKEEGNQDIESEYNFFQ